jgi:hypothetical protein
MYIEEEVINLTYDLSIARAFRRCPQSYQSAGTVAYRRHRCWMWLWRILQLCLLRVPRTVNSYRNPNWWWLTSNVSCSTCKIVVPSLLSAADCKHRCARRKSRPKRSSQLSVVSHAERYLHNDGSSGSMSIIYRNMRTRYLYLQNIRARLANGTSQLFSITMQRIKNETCRLLGKDLLRSRCLGSALINRMWFASQKW